jgi:hypothetical protein
VYSVIFSGRQRARYLYKRSKFVKINMRGMGCALYNRCVLSIPRPWTRRKRQKPAIPANNRSHATTNLRPNTCREKTSLTSQKPTSLTLTVKQLCGKTQDARTQTQQTVSTSITNTENIYNEHIKGGKAHTNNTRDSERTQRNNNNPYHWY